MVAGIRKGVWRNQLSEWTGDHRNPATELHCGCLLPSEAPKGLDVPPWN